MTSGRPLTLKEKYRIRSLHEESGMTVSEIAREMGLSRRVAGYYANNPPSVWDPEEKKKEEMKKTHLNCFAQQ